MGFPVGVLCGVVGESHWWDVWWAGGESGWGLVGVCLVLEFPCLGACVYGDCGLGCLGLPYGFSPWIVPLMFGA